MKQCTTIFNSCKWVNWLVGLCLLALMSACNPTKSPVGSVALNSRYTDEQPTLSGNGRLVAFVTNRNGNSQIALYDLRTKEFIDLPGLNRTGVIFESPSLSQTGRYLVYLTSEQGRPEIALYDRAIQQAEVLTQRYRYWVRNPQISPDGRYIVFETARRGQWDIEVLDRGPNIELDIPDGTPINSQQ